MHKKAQVGIEFLFLISAALFFFMIIIAVIYANIGEKQNEKEAKEVKQLALLIKEEIDIAHETSNGYHRVFYVPKTIEGKNYIIKIQEGHIYVLTDRNSASYKIKEVIGSIQKGKNIIKKENETVYLNT